MHKNENRPGYKYSKVGWIPAGWDSVSLGRHIDLNTGFPFKSYNYTNSSQSIKLLRGDNIAQGYLCWTEAVKWPAENIARLNNFQLKEGDLVIAMDRTWVKAGLKISVVREHDLPCLLVQRVARLRATNGVDKHYLPLLIHRNYFEQYVKGVQTETVVPHISSKQIQELPVCLPPLPEQKAIAGVLECWDRGIRNLELKIEKKRLVKNGLMQRLLSGKQRLNGATKLWKRVRLGDVFEFISSYAFSRECLTTEAIENTDIYNIHYGDIHARYTGPTLDLSKERRVPMLKTGSLMPSMMDFLQDGDLVMADVSEDYEGIGTCIELKNLTDKRVTGGLHTFVMRDTSKQTAAGFRGYMFKEYRLSKELKRIATGVSVYSLSKTNLSEVELDLPPLDEQQAIAGVLSAADSEIEALEKKLALWKEQKKYLLNNLLTGTIRLPQFCLKA